MPKRSCVPTRFRLYRYQILPISQQIQTQFAPHIVSIQDLKARKNEFFADALEKCKFEDSNKIAHDQITAIDGNVFVLRLAVNRTIRLNRRDFSVASIEDWPYCWVVINNDPSVQKLAVQINPKVPSIASTICHFLAKCLKSQLRHYQLCPIIEPLFDRQEFWTTLGSYRGKLLQLDFELISPNLANISKHLTLDLHALNQATNTQWTHFQLNSDKRSCLTIDPKNQQIAGLVNYASEGGGDITMRVRGYRKKIRTRDCQREISIDSIDIEKVSPQEIVSLLNNLKDE